MTQPNQEPKHESICQEAHRIQGGDRQQDYGSPKQNFEDIAHVWTSYLQVKRAGHPPVDAVDVAHMMILMKIVRNNHKPKRDNAVDIAGYAQCLAKIQGFDYD
jgi:hypothetical protein